MNCRLGRRAVFPLVLGLMKMIKKGQNLGQDCCPGLCILLKIVFCFLPLIIVSQIINFSYNGQFKEPVKYDVINIFHWAIVL